MYEGTQAHRVHARHARKLKDHVLFLAELANCLVELADGQVFKAAHQVVYDAVLSFVTFDKHFCSFWSGPDRCHGKLVLALWGPAQELISQR
jgi:hypothetical protein